MQNVMSPFEMGLVAIFHNTGTTEEERKALIKLDILEKQAVTIEESDIIKDCMDFLFTRGNLRILESRL